MQKAQQRHDKSACRACQLTAFRILLLLSACRKVRFAKKSTWTHDEIIGMKREALLDCFDTMKACYGQAWAKTSVDLAIQVSCKTDRMPCTHATIGADGRLYACARFPVNQATAAGLKTRKGCDQAMSNATVALILLCL